MLFINTVLNVLLFITKHMCNVLNGCKCVINSVVWMKTTELINDYLHSNSGSNHYYINDYNCVYELHTNKSKLGL